MKQKTALTLGIEKLKELQSDENIGSFTKRAYAIAMDVLEDLKPIERQQIGIAFNDGYCDKRYYKDYFNQTLTQD